MRAKNQKPNRLASVLLCALLMGCGSEAESDSQTSNSGSATAGQAGAIWFEDVAKASGVDFVHTYGPRRWWIPEVTGSGLGLFDMDADGDLDLYLLQGGDLEDFDREKGLLAKGVDAPTNRLYRNDGKGNFEDVTEAAGVGHTGFGMGCAVGDYDQDGKLDLYVTNLGPNVLYRNLGGGRFENVTPGSGAGGKDWSSAASFVDFDGDGWEDIFVVNYLLWEPSDETICPDLRGDPSYCDPNRYRGPAQDRLYRNRGDGTFEDVSKRVGLDQQFGNGLGLVWGEIDKDRGIDFYVANDGNANQYWVHTRDASGGIRLVDQAMIRGCALSGNGQAEAGMGTCLEDINRDGSWDFLVTHLTGQTNTFYMGGARGFRDQTARSGTSGASLVPTGFGVGLADFDHDGWADMYVANGRVTPAERPTLAEFPLAEEDQVFRGAAGGKLTLLDPPSGTQSPAVRVSRGAAFGDIDNDGDVDVIVSDNGARLRILRNVADKGSNRWATWSVLERNGLPAVGAVLRFDSPSGTVQRQVQRTSSYCASNDPRINVGLGSEDKVDAVQVTWLDGTIENFGPLKAGEFASLQRGQGRSAD